MLTLSQIKEAYQAAISNSTIGVTFAIRDYLLYRIYENTYSGSSGGGTAESINSVVATSNGSVSAGGTCVMMETSEDFVGNINGVARRASQSYTFRANYNNYLPAISYTISAGSITIDRQTNTI